MSRILLLVIIIAIVLVPVITVSGLPKDVPLSSIIPLRTIEPAGAPSPSPIPIPRAKTLQTDYHVFQSFNNCGPAALSMALRFYDIVVSQQELGMALRPYQNPRGDNDDKSTTLAEIAEKARDYNLVPFHRPLGNASLVKQFIALDIPVIARTLLEPQGDIGHYRVVKGYDEDLGQFIQDDSLQGKNLRYSYGEFNELWKQFNYEYVVLVPPEKVGQAEQILGEHVNELTSWTRAAEHARGMLNTNPEDVLARFNLSVALYHIKDYQGSVSEFEKVENKLSFRTLWYQIEPILAYYELGNFDRVFAITDKILNNSNRAFSELYIIRGDIYRKQGNIELARAEYAQAVLYNNTFKDKVPTL